MIRRLALAAASLCLAGCFVFDNPFDTQSRAAITFRIVVNSPSYGGTYMWNPTDNAYEATIGGARYYVYMSSSLWLLAGPNSMSIVIASSTYGYLALPPTTNAGWSPPDVLTTVDDSTGGISPQLKPPDSTVSVGDTLQVAFDSTIPGVGAKYQWQGSNNSGVTSPTTLGTGSTYHVLDATYPWIRVTITPTDGAGNIIGPAVTSPPVRLS